MKLRRRMKRRGEALSTGALEFELEIPEPASVRSNEKRSGCYGGWHGCDWQGCL